MDTIPDQLGYLPLVVLALVDSTSIGTLVIPILLLVTADPRAGAGHLMLRTLYYLLVIGVFYWLLGVVLTAGASPLFERFSDGLTSIPALTVYAVIGIGMVVWSYRIDPATIRKKGGDPEESGRRWMQRVRNVGNSLRALTGLALLAGVIEAATMVPYLAAIGLIVDSGAGLGGAALILVAYCGVMLLPGAVFAVARGVAGARVDGVLTRVQNWSVRNAAGAVSWTIGIVGVLVVLHTAPDVLESYFQ